MRSLVRTTGVVFTVGVLLASIASGVGAQGVTSAAVRGRVVDSNGQPVVGATVILTNTSTGETYRSTSRSEGRYSIENVAVGGPYAIEARRIGFQPETRTGFILRLGQGLNLDLTLQPSAVQLSEIVVTAEEQDPLVAESRTGATALISDTAVSRLPTLNRNFTDFVVTAPQVTSAGGVSIGGGHRKMNNIQIDGVSDNDLFGLGATGQPGGQVGAKSITLEAVKEFQVLVAPFDIRQGGFAGGLVNAVTKRGTNTFHGSAFWYFQDDALVRDSLPANGVVFGDYRQHQRGFSIGGPIVRDRVHFFFAGEWQRRQVPIGGPTIGRETPDDVGITATDAQTLVTTLQGFGVDPGSFSEVPIDTPNRNIFGRVDIQLDDNNQLTIRHNHVHASNENLSHSTGRYRLTSNGYAFRSNTNSTALQLNSTLGGGKFFNELRLGYNVTNDIRRPNQPFPQIDVETSAVINGLTRNGEFRVGAEQFSQLNSLDQYVFEITDDFTIPTGDHTLTFGTHNEFISFNNKFFHSSIGVWQFDSLADLQAGTASSFFRQIPFDPARGAPIAEWNVNQLGLYAQDQWRPNSRLQITAGLRIDVPIITDNPVRNQAVEAPFGIRTNDMPSGNIHWSPRAGFNYDVRGDRSTIVRGGLGVFTGRPAYVWLSNAFTNTGREVQQVSCRASSGNMPVFTADPNNQPMACAGGGGVFAPTSQINVFTSDFRFPQVFKASLAVDQRLPYGLLGTAEFLYTYGINSIRQRELNIPQTPIGTNAEGRLMFGTGDSRGGGAQRVDPAFTQVLLHSNRSGDRTYQLTLQLQKVFSQGFEMNASYTHSDVKDYTSLTSSIATSNFGFHPVSRGGNPNDVPLSKSWFDIPDKITVSGTVNIPIPSAPTALTLLYVGQSGQPYTWTVDGDANGDGYEGPGISRRNNDIVYVPLADGSDFTGENPNDFTDYNAFIQSESCLREARGSIPERNTCRNPWSDRVDASLRVSLGNTFGGAQRHNLTFVADVFNLLNLLNSDWGTVRAVTFNQTRELLDFRGFDAVNNRPIYRFAGPSIDSKASVSDLRSRWRAQFGLRYDF